MFQIDSFAQQYMALKHSALLRYPNSRHPRHT